MLTVRFFSLVREALATETLTLAWSPALSDVAAVKAALAAEHGDDWQSVLFQPNLVHAVNQRVVWPEHPVADGDELAFFPPMTGG